MEKVKEIIESIKDALIYGDIEFVEKEHLFSSDTERYFTYKTEDESSEFHIKISISDDMKTVEYSSSVLTIKNENLVDKTFYIFSNNSDELREVIDIIFNNKIKPNIKVKNQEDVFSDILNSIGDKSSRRDKKINEILSSEICNKKVEDDTIWRRIFKKW